MCLITCTTEQQRLRQDLANATESKNSNLFEKFTKPAFHSSTSYEIAKAAETVKSQAANQLALVRKQIKNETAQPPAKRVKVDGAVAVANGASAAAPKVRKTPAWTRLAQDGTLKFCGAYDTSARKRCGWNNSHFWGDECPVRKKDSSYVPRHWGPFGAQDWTEENGRGQGIKQKDLIDLYQKDVKHFLSNHKPRN